MRKNGLLANGLIWLGAATSIAEIEAGLHCRGNLSAVLLGHLLGFALLFAAGLIGGRTRQSAMRTVAEAFGDGGCRFFAGLNLLQLVGWAAVMVSMGASASSVLFPQIGFRPFCLVVGGLATLMLLIDFRHATILSTCTVCLLATLASVLTVRILSLPPAADLPVVRTPSFAAAFELSVAMPLSWLPLISDHTKDADRPAAVAFVSALAYSSVSVWMYALGMMIAETAADAGVAQAILHTGIGMIGLLIVIVSTSLSAFFDLYSSGESGQALWHRLPSKSVGAAAGLLGIGLAVGGIQERYAGFLYLIASVFAPMATVLLVAHYLVRHPRRRLNFIAWLSGFLAYRFAGGSPLGPTLTAVLVSAAIALLGIAK